MTGNKAIGKQTFSIHNIHLKALPRQKQVFFASDFHLGAPDYTATHTREKKIVRWLNSIQPEAHALFLLGDIFDGWFEYKQAIPKGFARLQGKLADFADQAIPVYLLVGNHELGIRDYFLRELNITVLRNHTAVNIADKTFLVGHGDEFVNNWPYKFLKKFIYNNPICQWLFRQLHPDVGLPLAAWISNKGHQPNRMANVMPKKDHILVFCKEKIEPYWHHDFYVFGHLHKPYHAFLHPSSSYYNLGDWINHGTYGVFDGAKFEIAQFE